MPKAVANSTPIIVLSNINKIEILKKLYEVVYVPYGVFEEVSDCHWDVRSIIKAKEKGLLKEIKPLLDEIIQKKFLLIKNCMMKF
jgi:predicted nucleic acid-binding protein